MKTALLASLTLLALAACDCPKTGPPPPRFSLNFSSDTASVGGRGFRRAEVRSAYLIRYASADFQQLLDTLRQGAAVPAARRFYISRNPGYPASLTPDDYDSPNAYARSFVLVVPAAAHRYTIANVVITQEPGSGRCAEERTTRNQATVNGQLYDALNSASALLK